MLKSYRTFKSKSGYTTSETHKSTTVSYDASINLKKHLTAYAHCDTIVRTTMILHTPGKNGRNIPYSTLLAWIILTYSKIMVSKPPFFFVK